MVCQLSEDKKVAEEQMISLSQRLLMMVYLQT